jgi:hydroxymethylbilane synthase
MTQPIRIGTRGSKLALWEAHFLQHALAQIEVPSELRIIKTQGDRIQHLSFDKMEGKGFFTKEIEDALLRGDIDLAVHSMKDLPTTPPEGLVISALSQRANPADWLVIRKACVADQPFKLKTGAIVGTSSARRKAQMKYFRPDIEWKDIRGNVPTRLGKLASGDFDAILLAAAGIQRLEIDLSEYELVQLNPREFIPAPAQGVLAFQTCADDLSTRRILKKIHHPEVADCTNIERGLLKLLDGGCHMPLGAYCERDAMGNYHFVAALADDVNSPVRRAQISSSTKHQLAEQMLEKLRMQE